jgi:predicted transcriptional regulator
VPTRRPPGELEHEVLVALWAAPDALTPADALAELGGSLAYTTVLTILGRLWKKGLVTRERRGRAYAYRPVMSEAELAASRMRAAFERATDREAVLSQFVGSLTKREERVLRRVVADLDAGR